MVKNHKVSSTKFKISNLGYLKNHLKAAIMKNYDAIIIGSGQAGTPLAFKLASEKLKVAFIEKKHLGRTCVNVGCTPTKTYVASARRAWEVRNAERLGVKISNKIEVDLKAIKARKDKLVNESVDGIASGLEKNEFITHYQGEAHFVENKVVEVNNQQLTADEIYINVGARPNIPDAYKNVDFLTNESILALEEVPAHLIIVGGSYIGLEFGQMFKRFGAKVTIIERSDSIIKKEDPETSEAIQQFMEDEGIEFELNSTCISAKNEDHQISVQVHCEGEAERNITGSHLLLAIGRKPNSDLLQLENTEIKLSNRGFIEVNHQLETNVKGVFALGDVNGKGAFTHTAYNDFEIISDNKFKATNRKVSDRILTYGLFVDPPMGRVGLTKNQALKEGFEILYGHKPMSEIARAKEKGETNGFMSVVINKKTNKILGATVLGVGGDEIISTLITAKYAGMDYHDLIDSVQPHPTVNELIPTMLESLEEVKA
ncbi:mercuric reductase [Psychroflexus salis]|uniref:Mercuric reductase n=2 Tax=Psychroflexus salis TaxID=1526574 RepID=A0A917ECC9_9FLAO|nr:mercuric reductase [Psychroflexus salis]